ncbi:hypothetical protein LTR66_014524, partial [Elasticomyces elasticus]
TSESVYCSQACRLADLEKAGASTPTSPFSTSSSCEFLPWTSSALGTGSAFVLPPAIDFSNYSNMERTLVTPTSTRTADHDRTSYFAQPHTSQSAQTVATAYGLTPSSSRTSLSSTISTASTLSKDGLSEQARLELQQYVSSFDRTRDWKRRSSLR